MGDHRTGTSSYRDPSLPRHVQAIWDGSPLAGRRVLIRCYHGLGDTLQFIRYAPLVKAVASEVIVWAQPGLLPLLRTAHGIDRLLPLHGGVPEVEYDVDVEVMELPFLFRTTPRTIPSGIPYLRGDAPKPASARRAGLRIGIVWQVTRNDWMQERSIPFELIRPMTDLPNVELHVVQRGPALGDLPPSWGVHSGSDDVLRAAESIRTLDLLVTVDSMPAHLAGALGVPVWTLLPHVPDWRWMDARSDSPWYPTMRLFRQTVPVTGSRFCGRCSSCWRGGLRAARLLE